MTGQFRDEIGQHQNTRNGKRVWIVGTGPSIDDTDLGALRGQYIFALNSAAIFFKNVRKYPDAWWLWWDLRVHREVWPRLSDWRRVQVLIHKKGMEIMRSYRGSGRYCVYGRGFEFKPSRSVAETALLIAEFFGYDEAILVGIDGLAAKENNEPYCKAINQWKNCRFMERLKPGSWKASSEQFDAAMGKLLPRLKRIKVVQTSALYPNRERFSDYSTVEEVLSRDRAERKKEIINPSR